MRKRYILLFLSLFIVSSVFSQDTLVGKDSAKPSFSYKQRFKVSWPLSGFTYERRNIFYKSNVISDRVLIKLIEMEPLAIKKGKLIWGRKKIVKYKRLSWATFSLGTISLAGSYEFFLLGLFSQNNKNTNIAWSLFTVGAIVEISSAIFTQKKKEAKRDLVKILNE